VGVRGWKSEIDLWGSLTKPPDFFLRICMTSLAIVRELTEIEVYVTSRVP
jgi:hypothetical protein